MPANTLRIKYNAVSQLPFHLRLTVRRGYWCGGGKVGRRTIFQWRPARGYLCLASARRIVARRIPPPCRVSEREIASAPCENKPFRKPRGEGARSLSRGAIQVGGTNRFGYLLKQIKSTAFFGYLIKTHNMPLIPIKEEEKRHFLRHIICH